MFKLTKNTLLALTMIVAAPVALPSAAMADDSPLVSGDYTSVSGIYVQDGGDFAYATFLAGEWSKQQEFAKSKGWITDYHIYANLSARGTEPNLYLTETFPRPLSGAEGEVRSKEWQAFYKRSNATLDAESGSRAKFRTLTGVSMLQELKVRK